MFGAHLSIAGGLHLALLRAQACGFDTLQVFTKSQRQWASPPLADQEVTAWEHHLRRLGLRLPVAHASYLLNLASPDETAWSRSVALLQEEVSRCHRLGIPLLVVHPGSHLGSGVEAGLAQVARALDHAVAQAPDRSVTVCLEATAGQGTSVGHALEHLAAIRARLEHPARVGFCLDTAHLFAAGYDFRGRRYGPFIKQVDKILGAGTVRVLHLNDTEKPLGSRVDRHAHPGEGLLGRPGLQPLVRDPRFHDVPKIIETPPGLAPGGGDRDVYNVGLLRQWSRAGPG